MPFLNKQTCMGIFIYMQSVPYGVFYIIHCFCSPIKNGYSMVSFSNGKIYINVVWTNAKLLNHFNIDSKYTRGNTNVQITIKQHH